MVSLNIVIPEDMGAWIEDQAHKGRYVDAGDYIRDLIRQDQERSDKITAMQFLIDEGLESGVSDESMQDILASMNAAE